MANYCGIPCVEYVCPANTWDDPKLIYKNRVFNIHDVKDVLWDEFQAMTNNTGNFDEFVQWIHDNPYRVTDLLDDLIALAETETETETAC